MVVVDLPCVADVVYCRPYDVVEGVYMDLRCVDCVVDP